MSDAFTISPRTVYPNLPRDKEIYTVGDTFPPHGLEVMGIFPDGIARTTHIEAIGNDLYWAVEDAGVKTSPDYWWYKKNATTSTFWANLFAMWWFPPLLIIAPGIFLALHAAAIAAALFAVIMAVWFISGIFAAAGDLIAIKIGGLGGMAIGYTLGLLLLAIIPASILIFAIRRMH